MDRKINKRQRLDGLVRAHQGPTELALPPPPAASGGDPLAALANELKGSGEILPALSMLPKLLEFVDVIDVAALMQINHATKSRFLVTGRRMPTIMLHAHHARLMSTPATLRRFATFLGKYAKQTSSLIVAELLPLLHRARVDELTPEWIQEWNEANPNNDDDEGVAIRENMARQRHLQTILPSIMHAFPPNALQRIEIHAYGAWPGIGAQDLANVRLNALSHHAGSLQHMVIRSDQVAITNGLDNAWQNAIAKSFQSLRTYDVPLSNVTTFPTSRHLERLALRAKATPAFATKLVQACPNLTALSVHSDVTESADTALSIVVSALGRQLTELRWQCELLSSDTLLEALPSLGKLRCLSVMHTSHKAGHTDWQRRLTLMPTGLEELQLTLPDRADAGQFCRNLLQEGPSTLSVLRLNAWPVLRAEEWLALFQRYPRLRRATGFAGHNLSFPDFCELLNRSPLEAAVWQGSLPSDDSRQWLFENPITTPLRALWFTHAQALREIPTTWFSQLMSLAPHLRDCTIQIGDIGSLHDGVLRALHSTVLTHLRIHVPRTRGRSDSKRPFSKAAVGDLLEACKELRELILISEDDLDSGQMPSRDVPIAWQRRSPAWTGYLTLVAEIGSVLYGLTNHDAMDMGSIMMTPAWWIRQHG
jgi:hypothetical protein